MIPQRTFVTVHDSITVREAPDHNYDFSYNGLRILMPISCTVTEELNGSYICELEHAIDDDGAWRSLQENNILSVPILYHGKDTKQLFRILKVVPSLKRKGRSVRVTAYHIFYDLSARSIVNIEIPSASCLSAAQQLYNGVYKLPGFVEGLDWYPYTFYSDITDIKPLKFENVLLSDAILGDEYSVVNTFDGQIYRDNFYFSINKQKEKSIKHPFPIKYGVNMIEVEETVDVSNYLNCLHSYDNFGNWSDARYVDKYSSLGDIIRTVQFNYEESNIDKLKEDGGKYFWKYAAPDINLKVSFADLTNHDLYKDFIGLEGYEAGDTVDVICERINIQRELTIIKTVYDVLRRRKVSIELGSQKGSIIREPYMGKTVYRSPTDVVALQKSTVKSESVRKIVYLTEDEYNALETKDDNTIYVCK